MRPVRHLHTPTLRKTLSRPRGHNHAQDTPTVMTTLSVWERNTLTAAIMWKLWHTLFEELPMQHSIPRTALELVWDLAHQWVQTLHLLKERERETCSPQKCHCQFHLLGYTHTSQRVFYFSNCFVGKDVNHTRCVTKNWNAKSRRVRVQSQTSAQSIASAMFVHSSGVFFCDERLASSLSCENPNDGELLSIHRASN